jgi:hypothetical protein
VNRRSGERATVLGIIAVSSLVSYAFYTTGSFALSSSHHVLVPGSQYKSIQVWCAEGDLLSGSFSVEETGGVVDFYVMSENDIHLWNYGRYPSCVALKISVTSHIWNVTIPAEGYYFIVYSNPEGISSVHVQGNIVVTSSRSIIGPVIMTSAIISMALIVCILTIEKVRAGMSL